MVDEKKNLSTKSTIGKHSITMFERESLCITGVADVISFDEETVITATENDSLIIKGMDLHVVKLNLEKGELDIDGEIISLNYESSGGYGKNKASFLGKIFK